MIRLGERLYQERVRRGLTLVDIEKAIKIRASFLSAIEKGEYDKLPSSTYVHGFVRNYVEFLGLPEEEIMALFRREYDEEKAFRVLPEGFSKKQDFPLHRLKVGQTLTIILFLLVLLLGYMGFQYRYAIFAPPLKITSPKEDSIIYSQTTAIEGKTEPNSTVSINNDPVPVDAKGRFTKTITLFAGKSTIAIKAVSRFGKEKILELHVEVR